MTNHALEAIARRTYSEGRGNDTEPPEYQLPFVNISNTDDSGASAYWHVPNEDDYHDKVTLGMYYSAHFIQYLKDNPDSAGQNLMCRMVDGMHVAEAKDLDGYEIGFFYFLEKLISQCAISIDVFDQIEAVRRQHELAVDKSYYDKN